MLSQTVVPRRVVVVDDGSSDNTAEIALRFGGVVTCVRQRNRGVAAARNRGAQEVGTEWLAFLDQDDVWLPTKLQRQLACVTTVQREVVFTGIKVVDAQLSLIAKHDSEVARTDLEALLLRDDSIPQSTPSTILIKRSLFNLVGDYDEDLAMSADWDLLVRLRLKTELAYIGEPLVLYRRHASNLSRNVTMLEKESIRVLEKSFAARELPLDLLKLRRRCFAWNDAVLSGSHFRTGSWGRAILFGGRALWRGDRQLSNP